MEEARLLCTPTNMSIGSQENHTYCDADADADADAVVARSEIKRQLQHFHETLLRIHTDYATYQENYDSWMIFVCFSRLGYIPSLKIHSTPSNWPTDEHARAS